MMQEMSQELPIEDIDQVETLAVEAPEARRTTTLTASRQRAYTADLMKAHIALMEKEVILPRQVETFRLVNRNYRALQTWHDQFIR